MAGELLVNPKTPHLARFDIESFLYVFIYLCCMCIGPNGMERPESLAPDFLYNWLHPELQTIDENVGVFKLGLLTLPTKLYRNQVTNHFTPYMSVFKECVEGIQVLFKNRETEEVTHAAVIAEFEKIRDKLPENETISAPRIPKYLPRHENNSKELQQRRISQKIKESRTPKYHVSDDPAFIKSLQHRLAKLGLSSLNSPDSSDEGTLWETDGGARAESRSPNSRTNTNDMNSVGSSSLKESTIAEEEDMATKEVTPPINTLSAKNRKNDTYTQTSSTTTEATTSADSKAIVGSRAPGRNQSVLGSRPTRIPQLPGGAGKFRSASISRETGNSRRGATSRQQDQSAKN